MPMTPLTLTLTTSTSTPTPMTLPGPMTLPRPARRRWLAAALLPLAAGCGTFSNANVRSLSGLKPARVSTVSGRN
ncbi:MAG TPA: hypothetical protein PKA20_14635, partial [Burkholderiaceae bacterium]|nr:hypothetical protein [Burkholderiaceae bacterium]